MLRTAAAQRLLRMSSALDIEKDYLNSDLTFRMAQSFMEGDAPTITNKEFDKVYNKETQPHPRTLDEAAENVMNHGGFRQNAGGESGENDNAHNKWKNMTREQMEHIIATNPAIPKDEHGRMINEGVKLRPRGSGEAKFLSRNRLQELMKSHQHEDDGLAGHDAPTVKHHR